MSRPATTADRASSSFKDGKVAPSMASLASIFSQSSDTPPALDATLNPLDLPLRASKLTASQRIQGLYKLERDDLRKAKQDALQKPMAKRLKKEGGIHGKRVAKVPLLDESPTPTIRPRPSEHDHDEEVIDESFFGPYFPKGYKPTHGLHGKQWDCPMRSCQRTFAKPMGVRTHFNAMHRDNSQDAGDGTCIHLDIKLEGPPGIPSTGRASDVPESKKANEIKVTRRKPASSIGQRIEKNIYRSPRQGSSSTGNKNTPGRRVPSPITPTRKGRTLLPTKPTFKSPTDRNSSPMLITPPASAKRKTFQAAGGPSTPTPKATAREDAYYSDSDESMEAVPAGPVRPNPSWTADEVTNMQDWEVNPGTVRSGSGSSENMVSSSSYLDKMQVINVSNTVTVRLQRLASGDSWRVPVDADRLRVCTVLAGTLEVKLHDHDIFLMGRGGLFTVKAGQTCLCANRFYTDCEVQVCCVVSATPDA